MKALYWDSFIANVNILFTNVLCCKAYEWHTDYSLISTALKIVIYIMYTTANRYHTLHNGAHIHSTIQGGVVCTCLSMRTSSSFGVKSKLFISNDSSDKS